MGYDIQANYGFGHGWEYLCSAETKNEAMGLLSDYRENEPEYRHRIVRSSL